VPSQRRAPSTHHATSLSFATTTTSRRPPVDGYEFGAEEMVKTVKAFITPGAHVDEREVGRDRAEMTSITTMRPTYGSTMTLKAA